MIRINKYWLGMWMLLGALLLAGSTAQAATAEQQLQKGILAYQQKDNNKAMEYFVDVLMNGNAEQISQANKYIDAIHNSMGGISSPVEVNVNFPDQPTQTIVDKAANVEQYGRAELDSLATRSQSALDELKTGPKTLTEQIEESQLEKYLATPVSTQQGAAIDAAAVEAVEPVNKVNQDLQRDLDAIAEQEKQQAAPAQKTVTTSEEQPAAATKPNGTLTTTYAAPAEPSAALTASTFVDLTSDSAIEARNIYTRQKLQSLTDGAIAGLTSNPKVHLYLRDDGLPDAIDIDEDALFIGNAFRTDALPTLNYIYELLALTQGARYTILPAGSYADDVTLPGMRQAMALKSYLVKKGISQGKLNFNMGLVDQEAPTEFSNLKGLSIVFDYKHDLPTRLLENEENEKAPLLSMAIVPQCHSLNRALGEAYAIDFSVLETVDTLDNWVLQVIEHGRDGNFYIVRQLEGFSPVYHQILWNGRKGIIGPELPCGKYTIVLTAVDLKGKKQTLRRRVVVKCTGDQVPACQAGKCPVVSTGALNYKAARLWTKPGRIMRNAAAKEVVVKEESVAQVATTAQATSKSDSSYTVTNTVRNIVTEDTSSSSGVSSSQETYSSADAAGGYSSVNEVTNPYDMAYEEEYTEVTSN